MLNLRAYSSTFIPTVVCQQNLICDSQFVSKAREHWSCKRYKLGSNITARFAQACVWRYVVWEKSTKIIQKTRKICVPWNSKNRETCIR
jgi:hypothetical protein